MKIAFITSCLQPGCDGVGDYTRLLAGECERRGHSTALLALNDPFAGPFDANPMRLSPSLPWKTRVFDAGKYIDAFDPDIVSLQFVCYGFEPRGFVWRLASRLRAIIGKRPVQVMFHETWIGAGKNEGVKKNMAGAIQRFGILNIVRTLNVRAIHTSNSAYAGMLDVRGLSASVLPLFGSIPVPAPGSPAKVRGDSLVFGLFATLHPEWPPEPLISILLGTGKKIGIEHIGRIGSGEGLWNKLMQHYAGRIEFKRHGEQPPQRISEFFQREVDFGIATTPWVLIGKSATVAAMLEHGLPVIVNRDDWRIARETRSQPCSSLLIKMDESLPGKLLTARRADCQAMLPVVAGRFLGELERVIL
jgi:hypothetical protein